MRHRILSGKEKRPTTTLLPATPLWEILLEVYLDGLFAGCMCVFFLLTFLCVCIRACPLCIRKSGWRINRQATSVKATISSSYHRYYRSSSKIKRFFGTTVTYTRGPYHLSLVLRFLPATIWRKKKETTKEMNKDLKGPTQDEVHRNTYRHPFQF